MADRFDVELWNQYAALLENLDYTDNVSESWRISFRIVVAKHFKFAYILS